MSDDWAMKEKFREEEGRRAVGPKFVRGEEKTATALHYQPGAEDIAPVVIAQEQGQLAEELVARALARGVMVHEDADLASLLQAAGLGDEIPIEVFLVVAELFHYMYKGQDRPAPEVFGAPSPHWNRGAR